MEPIGAIFEWLGTPIRWMRWTWAKGLTNRASTCFPWFFGSNGMGLVGTSDWEQNIKVDHCHNFPRDPSTFSEGTWTLHSHPKHLPRRYLDP